MLAAPHLVAAGAVRPDKSLPTCGLQIGTARHRLMAPLRPAYFAKSV